MDSVVKVRRSFLNEIRGFCNRFASLCEGCYRSNCDCNLSDEIHKARNLIVTIDNIRDAEEERFFIENPMEEILAKLETAVRQGGGRPVKSSEMRIEGVNRTRKARALKMLVARRRIERIETDGEPIYVPAVGDKEKEQEKGKEERNGV